MTETTSDYDVIAEAERALHIPRHRAPYGPHERMKDILRKNSTPQPGRHTTGVTA